MELFISKVKRLCFGGIFFCIFILGCSSRFPGETLFWSDKIKNYEIVITRVACYPDNDILRFRLLHKGILIKGPDGFGPDNPKYQFKLIDVEGGNLFVVVENSRPNLILLAYNVKNGDFWPTVTNDSKGSESEQRLQQQLASSLGSDIVLAYVTDLRLNQ